MQLCPGYCGYCPRCAPVGAARRTEIVVSVNTLTKYHIECVNVRTAYELSMEQRDNSCLNL